MGNTEDYVQVRVQRDVDGRGTLEAAQVVCARELGDSVPGVGGLLEAIYEKLSKDLDVAARQPARARTP